MATRFTPGPWKAVSQTFLNGQTGDQGVHWWIVGPDGTPLPMAAGRNQQPAAECAANAALMAAAPELLAMLSELLPLAAVGVQHINSQMVGSLYPTINLAALDRAEAVIAKATGQ